MSLQDLQSTFFQDPRWAEVEDMIMKFIDPLTDMNTIDLKQPAEHVKAEIIGRTIAYNSLKEFLTSTKVLSRPLKTIRDPFE
jgi:hypothetical protein